MEPAMSGLSERRRGPWGATRADRDQNVVIPNRELKAKGKSGWSVVAPRTKGFGAVKVSVQAICAKTG